ncbi:MAG: NUDIX domain-containing protein [Sphingomonadales bacterium]|nr:NUDIX domain-containing protein [Sphingomonadales bacterium]
MALDPLRLPLRWAMRSIQQLRRLAWRIRKPGIVGAHAVAMSREGKVILVKLRYERGWSVPGGRRKAGETALENALREMREELGASAYGEPVHLLDEVTSINYRSDNAAVFLVPDVAYSPRWSLEIEAIGEFAPDHLPPDTSWRARKWIAAALERLPLPC